MIKLKPPTMQREGEINALAEFLARNNVKSVLEIGTNRGGTAYIFAQVADKVVTLDCLNWEKVYAGEPEEAKITVVIGDSRDPATIFNPDINQTFDFLFIDAEHTKYDVLEDFKAYAPLVKKGGWIGFHDILLYRFPGQNDDCPKGCDSKGAWEAIKGKYESFEILELHVPTDSQWGGIGVIKWEGEFK